MNAAAGRPRRRAPTEGLSKFRLEPTDLLRLGSSGLRSRPMRAALSALGIAIGIAAMVAVVGITASSQAELNQTLNRIGTNLLRVTPALADPGSQPELPTEAEAMIGRVHAVSGVGAVGNIPGTAIYRTNYVPVGQTNGIAIMAARPDLMTVLGLQLRLGQWFAKASPELPTVVLGTDAAKWLGVSVPGTRLWLGSRWYTLIGVLQSSPLAAELDVAALVDWAAAGTLGFTGHPSTIYVRAADADISSVRSLLAPTANPVHPDQVSVSRPSDALVAKLAADRAFTGLLLGVGAVALLVGAIGVANTMVIAVLERRREIGLRRALGARRGHIRLQFLTESLLLSAMGGAGGALLGALVTVGFAHSQGWPPEVPLWAVATGLGATMIVGVIAGSYPAIRAARVSPTEALAIG